MLRPYCPNCRKLLKTFKYFGSQWDKYACNICGSVFDGNEVLWKSADNEWKRLTFSQDGKIKEMRIVKPSKRK